MKPSARTTLAVGWLAIAAGALAAPVATAATSRTPTTSACSPVVLYGKQICLDVGSGAATATMIVQSGGRGWYGQVEIDGPGGRLVRTGDHQLGPSSSWPVGIPAGGSGRYCAVDWRWDVYHQVYFQENSVCLTAG